MTLASLDSAANQFVGNSGVAGGAAYLLSSTYVSAAGDRFEANTAVSSGGGVLASSSTATISDAFFGGNVAQAAGGALALVTSSAASVRNTTLHGCRAVSGAGFSVQDSTASLTGCVVEACVASADGGGIYAKGSSGLHVVS